MSLVALINLYLSIVIVLLFAVLAVAIAVKLATTHCNVIWGKRALRYRPKSIAHGILFGRLGRQLLCLSPEEDEGHVIVFGPSGAGKTSALLIPTLRSWQGTALVVDISGDISAHVDMPNKIVFDPTDIDTIPYDVFFSVDVAPNETEKLERLEQLAFLLLPDKPNDSEAGIFFTTNGRKILAAALISSPLQNGFWTASRTR